MSVLAGPLAALLNPTYGLPALLLLGAFAIWLAVRPSRRPRTRGAEPVPPEPDRDGVSRSYLALRRGEYSALLREVRDRLDRRIAFRTGLGLSDIPWRKRTARRMGIADPRSLRRLDQELSALELWSFRLETGSLLRRDFWRSEESSRRRLRSRLRGLLSAVGLQLAQFEGNR